MKTMLTMLVLAVLAGCRDEAALDLPSGLSVELAGTLTENQPDGETWLILRVLAPALAGRQVAAAGMAGDTALLCAEWGVPAAASAAPPPDQIVVQIMSEPVERGQRAPGVTQVFAGYRYENGACIWEDF